MTWRLAASTTYVLLAVVSRVLVAQDSARSPARVALEGFVDAYFAWDVQRPASKDRAFTTQAARHAEPNVNLAYVAATLSGNRVRGRLALQTGTSVQVNYAAEGDFVRLIQEATAGYRIGRAWVDAGIMLAPFGPESWISRDNWTYTRSLIAENSPYYEAGARITWQATKDIEAQLHVINGWQNVRETNGDKAIGARVQWTPSTRMSLVYDAFLGNEEPDSLARRPRLYQEVIVRRDFGARLSTLVAIDWGAQRSAAGETERWWGYSALTRVRLSNIVGVAGRVERYADPRQVIVKIWQAGGFVVNGASLNVDAQLAPHLVWRSEVRLLRSAEPIFPKRRGELSAANTVAVVSLALTP